MSRRWATLFSLIGEMTALLTMWESWRNARMAQFIPWRATLAMPAGSRAIQLGAVQSTVTECLTISRAEQKKNQRFYSSGSFALHIPCAVPAMIVSSESSKVSKSASSCRRRVVFSIGLSECMYWSTDMWNIVTS